MISTAPLDLSPISETIYTGLVSGAAGGLAVIGALYGIIVIQRAFKGPGKSFVFDEQESREGYEGPLGPNPENRSDPRNQL